MSGSLEHRIYRITREDRDVVLLSITEIEQPGLEHEIIASAKTEGLRDLLMRSFRTVISTSPDVYPHHRIFEDGKIIKP